MKVYFVINAETNIEHADFMTEAEAQARAAQMTRRHHMEFVVRPRIVVICSEIRWR